MDLVRGDGAIQILDAKGKQIGTRNKTQGKAMGRSTFNDGISRVKDCLERLRQLFAVEVNLNPAKESLKRMRDMVVGLEEGAVANPQAIAPSLTPLTQAVLDNKDDLSTGGLEAILTKIRELDLFLAGLSKKPFREIRTLQFSPSRPELVSTGLTFDREIEVRRTGVPLETNYRVRVRFSAAGGGPSCEDTVEVQARVFP